MVEEEEEELKKILNIQNKQINILKDQVMIGSRRQNLDKIQDLGQLGLKRALVQIGSRIKDLVDKIQD